MNCYQINAKLLSPLMIQENRQSNSPRNLPYLPGSSLRGAAAAKYLRTGGSPEDQVFRQIFLENPVGFPDLLPIWDPAQCAFPLPMTACSCKREPRFKTQNGHGIGDMLAALMAGEMEEQPVAGLQACTVCGHDMKPQTGSWNGDTTLPRTCEPMIVYQRHTGIDRHTGTVAPSVYYITQGIAESRKDKNHADHPQYLTGSVYLEEGQFLTLSEIFNGPVFAGADRTRGMGEMEISLVPSKEPSWNILEWNENFKKKVSGLTSVEIPPGIYFTVGLIGHAILVDRFLRPSADISFDFGHIYAVTRLIRQHVIRGWQSSWGLPKNEDMAIGSGGVYLFRYTGHDVKGLEEYLKQMHVSGIGLRRAEGFGRIRICDPLHVQEVI